jgi:hypothetical protein
VNFIRRSRREKLTLAILGVAFPIELASGSLKSMRASRHGSFAVRPAVQRIGVAILRPEVLIKVPGGSFAERCDNDRLTFGSVNDAARKSYASSAFSKRSQTERFQNIQLRVPRISETAGQNPFAPSADFPSASSRRLTIGWPKAIAPAESRGRLRRTELRKLRIQFQQRAVNQLPNASQRMILRHPRRDIEIRKQRSRTLICLCHPRIPS